MPSDKLVSLPLNNAPTLNADALHYESSLKQTATIEAEEELQEIVPGWPLLSTSCIYFVEFCERFSTFGVRLILSKYVSDSLGLNGELQIVIFLQLFAFFSFGTSPIGAIVSDLFAGKFWTLFWTLCLMFLCEVALLVPMLFFSAGHPGFPFVEILGLFMLAACSGALKPSLAAMGADQFFHIPFNYLEISCFFAIFYFIGTAANFCAVFTFPTMLMFPCLGYESCILLPFAVPAVLIFLCAVLLICTICLYDRPFGPPVGMFLIYRAIGTVRKTLANRKARVVALEARPPPVHWLDYFLDDHNCFTDALCQDKRRYMTPEESFQNLSSCAQREFLDQLKALFRVSVMLLLMPFFFVFYNQCTYLWKRQALSLDPMTVFGFSLMPDHIPLVHIVLLLVSIPFFQPILIFQLVIYPLWFRCCCCFPTYLKRMTGGALLLALAFTVSAALQHIVDMTQPPQPSRSDVFIKVANHFPLACSLTVTDMGPVILDVPSRQAVPFSIDGNDIIQLEGPINGAPFIRIQPVITFSATPDCMKHHEVRYKMDALVGHFNYIFVTPQGIFSRSLRYEKPTGSNPGESTVSFSVDIVFSVNLALPCKTVTALGLTSASCLSLKTDIQRALVTPIAQSLILCRQIEGSETRVDSTDCDINNSQNVVWKSEEGIKAAESLLTLPPVGDKTGKASVAIYAPKSIQPGSYRFYLTNGLTSELKNKTERTLIPIGGQFDVTGVGGVYSLTLALNGSVLLGAPTLQPTLFVETVALANILSIQWQLLQYVLAVFAEILFCATGLEFAYVEAPVVLKSVVLSMWFTGMAFGNFISFFFEFIFNFNRLVDHFFFNAAAMYTFTAILVLLAYSYYDYFNFSLPSANEPHDAAADADGDHTADGASVEMISALGAMPELGDDDVKRASLRISAVRRVTNL